MSVIRLIPFFFVQFFFPRDYFSQTNKEEANRLFNQAVKSFKARNYLLADSLFSASLLSEKHPDTYYSRAVCRNYLGDVCGYCSDLNSAAQMGDRESKKQLRKDCVQKDSLYIKGEQIMESAAHRQLKKVWQRTECLHFNEVLFYNDSNRVILAYEYEDGRDTLYSNCEQMPSYVGGTPALYSYLSRNIQYPASARIQGISGKVYVQFKVLSNGLAQDYEILKGVKNCFECDMEAVRVIRSIAHWYPAKHQGRAVTFRMILPINFKIQ